MEKSFYNKILDSYNEINKSKDKDIAIFEFTDNIKSAIGNKDIYLKFTQDEFVSIQKMLTKLCVANLTKEQLEIVNSTKAKYDKFLVIDINFFALTD